MRVSKAEREHRATVGGDLGAIEPPAPIEGLSRDATQEWRALCAGVPPGYFKPISFPLLGQLCQHLAIAKHLAKLIHRERSFSTNYMRLIREHRAETKAVLNCLRALRLTPLSNYARDRASLPEAPLPKPWLS
jgi:hypothetical protein